MKDPKDMPDKEFEEFLDRNIFFADMDISLKDKLRQCAFACAPGYTSDVCTEAADEIERLRKAGDRLCECHSVATADPQAFHKQYAEAIVAWAKLTS